MPASLTATETARPATVPVTCIPAPDHSASAMRRAFVADTAPLQHQGVIRRGIWTYISALLLIAAFSIAFHFLTDRIVHQQEATARIVNISGRQRMLTQRIVRLALERAAHAPFRPDAENQAELKSALQTLITSHQALSHGSAALQLPVPEGAVRQVYFGQPYALDDHMQDFIHAAGILADEPADRISLSDPALAAVELAAHDSLLTTLSAAVSAYQSSSEASIQHLRGTLALITGLMLLILLLEAIFLYRPLFRRLAFAQDELIEIGRTDPLTGSLNRRAFTQEAHRILLEAQATGQAIAVLMIDIDRFKSINDRFGHPVGDRVINSVVATLLRETIPGNLLCRMGGEEFAVLLRGNTLASATVAADHLRHAVAGTSILSESNMAIPVTVSIGVASLDTSDVSIFQVLGRADKALYRAKVNGRNRIEAEQLETGTGLSGPYPTHLPA